MAVRGWAGQYIGDGMMIAAAVGMRLEFETRDFDSNVRHAPARHHPSGSVALPADQSRKRE
jgi:hypothetical protein